MNMIDRKFEQPAKITVGQMLEWKKKHGLRIRELAQAMGIVHRAACNHIILPPETELDQKSTQSILWFAYINDLGGLPGVPKMIMDETAKKLCEGFLSLDTDRKERTIGDVTSIAKVRRMCGKYLPEGRRYPHKKQGPEEVKTEEKKDENKEATVPAGS
jgi:hypothetical protein